MGGDWLESMDDPEGARQAQKDRGLDFAKMHLVFLEDARGRALIEFWQKTVLRKRVPVNASVQEYAAHEAVRNFVQTIEDQIRFAQTEG